MPTDGSDGLQLLRRADFRFLLPHPRLGDTLLLGDDELLRAGLGRCARLSTATTSVEAAAGSYDVAVAPNPPPASVDAVLTLVRPGGWLYLEMPRRRLLSRPGRPAGARSRYRSARWWAGRLRAAGYLDVRTHWHVASFADCSKIVALQDPAAVRHLLGRHDGSARTRLMSIAGTLLLKLRLTEVGLLDTSVLGRRGTAGAPSGTAGRAGADHR